MLSQDQDSRVLIREMLGRKMSANAQQRQEAGGAW